MLIARTTQTFWGRFRGLMLTAGLDENEGLLLPGCPSVHTCFMRYPLDIVYLDKEGYVVKLVPHLKPWRASMGGHRAAHVLELSAGGIARHRIRAGGHATTFMTEAPALFAGKQNDSNE